MDKYKIVRERLQAIVDEIKNVNNNVELIKKLEELQEQIEFDLDCAFHS